MVDTHTLRNAAVGAIVSVLLSPIAVSPLLGGGLAGYLEREPPKRGFRVGAVSGLFASIPFALVLLLGFGLLLGGFARFGLPGAIELVIVQFVMVTLLVGWAVVLGAVGGYVGAAIRDGPTPSAGEPNAPEHGA